MSKMDYFSNENMGNDKFTNIWSISSLLTNYFFIFFFFHKYISFIINYFHAYIALRNIWYNVEYSNYHGEDDI